MAVDADLAGRRLVQAGDELAQRGLAAARIADKRHPLTGRHVEREVLDKGRLEAAVAEADALHRQVTGGTRLGRRGRRLREAPVAQCSQHVVEPRQVGRSLLDLAGDADHLLDRRGEADQQALKRHQRADAQVSVHDQQRPDAQDGGRRQAEKHRRHRVWSSGRPRAAARR